MNGPLWPHFHLWITLSVNLISAWLIYFPETIGNFTSATLQRGRIEVYQIEQKHVIKIPYLQRAKFQMHDLQNALAAFVTFITGPEWLVIIQTV